jgi:hypothetical protein
MSLEVKPSSARQLSVQTEYSSSDLLIVRGNSALQRQAFVQPGHNLPAGGVLVCPESWSPPSRFLVLDDGTNDSYLERALQLCWRLRMIPILLTLGRSERGARQRQQKLRHTLGDRSHLYVYDTVIGSDVNSAVARVARWRNCQTAIACHCPTNPWLRWLHTSPAVQLLDQADSLSLLALPHASMSELAAPTAAGMFLRPNSSGTGIPPESMARPRDPARP